MVEDTTSKTPTTIKVERIKYPDGQEDVNIYQIEGSYETLEHFNREARGEDPSDGLVNFISLDIKDGRKLVNALTGILTPNIE